MTTILLLLAIAQAPEPQEPPASTVPVAPQPSPEGTEHGLGEEVITGEVDVRIDDPKFMFAPRIDPYSPVDSLLEPENYVFDDALYRSVDSLTIPHHFTRSSYLRVPVESDLLQGDIMVFFPTFESRVSSWELVVSNSLGETVRRVTGRGSPPAALAWDGRTDGGEPIATGEIYSFTFNAYDATGNQTRLPGAPRRIDGMVFKDADEWIVSVAADQIFEPGTVRLTEDAGRRLDEVANVIKERYKKEVVIFVYSELEKLSNERCTVMRNEIDLRTVLPAEALKVAPRFTPGRQPKFSKIEVHIL